MCGSPTGGFDKLSDPAVGPAVNEIQRKAAEEAAAKITADASNKAAQERTLRRRRIRASSLLASGGAGDDASLVTGQPYAKPVLGA
jgi:hypothetical protein